MFMPLKDLPKPDGKFIIGTDIIILEDNNRRELFTEDPNDNRKIVVQIWYPAADHGDSIYPYIDYPDIRASYISERLGVPEFMIKHFSTVKTNSYYKARYINDQFPVIIFSHGLGGNRTQNSANIESLASNGYIVFAIEHTFDANVTVFNDSTFFGFDSHLDDDISKEEFYNVRIPQIKTRAEDISFLIDQLSIFKSNNFYMGKISNTNNIGVFGHSFGGGAVVVSSYLDSRIDACINLDGWFEPIPQNVIKKGLSIPFCYIGQIQKNWVGAPYNEKKILEFHNNNTNNSHIIEIAHTKHFDYADIPYLTRISRLLGLSGKAGKNLTLDLNKTITSFFNMHLKGKTINWGKDLKNNYHTINNIK